MVRHIIIWCILFLPVVANAQQSANNRVKQIHVTQTETTIDTLSIVPNSTQVFYGSGAEVDSALYAFDFAKARFLWKGEMGMQLKIVYKVFPILFSRKYYHKDIKAITELPIDNSAYYTYRPQRDNNTLFTLPGLNKSGSISRGVMFGNNQNLSLNSAMNLQLSGKIANGIEILAAISDDNLPIQPQGNTQQLNEFDKVFIQVKKDSTTLIAGDYELTKPEGYFMNFYKRTQGGLISHAFRHKGVYYNSSLALAVAKGRSARNTFNGQEGNQGPYRLTGNNNESYIVIIAGTERVYIDGALMIRGQDNDYVIDYNTAELTFMAKRLITQNSRISVEFEYSDKNYSRSLTFFSQTAQTEKLALRLNYYNEKDNRNQPFLQNLDNGQKQFLSQIGADISQAFYPNVTEVEFNENEILYEKVIGGTSSYYRYSTDPQKAKYRLGFSYVGEGKGNYVINTQSAANGKVYEYLEPINGIPQGGYEPITLLITPKQQQMLTFGADFKPRKNALIRAELATSNYNVNLFAPSEQADNKGYGAKLKAGNDWNLNTKSLLLKTWVDYEYVTENFKPIERYRTVEFNRDFNLNAQALPAAEYLIAAKAQLINSPQQYLNYAFNTFIRQGQYEGYLNEINTQYKWQKLKLKYDGSLLNTDAKVNKGTFYKHFFDLSREMGKIDIGLVFEQQHNITKDALSQNHTGNSFNYEIYKVYAQSGRADKNRYKIDYAYRLDYLPRLNDLLQSAKSQMVNVGIDLAANPNSTLSLTSGYKKTIYANNFVSTQNDESVVGRLEYYLGIFKRFISTNIYYEVGNGQEPKRDITYLEVLPGQGVYAWIDYNGNGIKELDEFEIARFPDQAKYIRIFTPSTQYVRTNFTGISQTVNINPSTIIKNRKGLSGLISKFTDQLSYKIDKKILAGTGIENYDPFYTAIDAANLISLNSFLRNTLFFDRNNPVFGAEFNYLTDGAKSYLSSGFDSRKRNEAGLRIRTGFMRSTNINLVLNQGIKRYESELFKQRNYRINYFTLQPEVNYQFNTDLRVSFVGVLNLQKNEAALGGESNENLTFLTEGRYNVLKKGVLTGKLSYINNNFKGSSNSTVGYEMLSGLQTGNNYTWALGVQRNIGAGIQLNLNYEGRKSPEVAVVHTGTMQVRAYF